MILCMFRRLGGVAVLACVCAAVGFAQGRASANWTTSGSDAQRSSWLKNDPKISPESVAKPGFGLLWKLPLGFVLTPMVVLDPYTGYRGHKSLGYLSGSGGDIFSVDLDLGIVEWREHRSRTEACAGGFAAPVTRPSASVAGRPNAVYTVSPQGELETMFVSNGMDAEPPVKFVPAGSKVQGLVVVDNVVYAETSAGGCKGTVNGLFALDLASKQVNNWTTNAPAWAGAGPAFGPEGTIYATAGNAFAALEPRTLRRKGYRFLFGDVEFATSPVVFALNDKTVVAAATRDGTVHFVNPETLAEVGVEQTMAKTPIRAGAALATWQDAAGVRWLLAPTGDAITAWRVFTNEAGAPVLQPGWRSREIATPLNPIVVNGVVFTAASRKAVLCALDGTTGKELWNSGDQAASKVTNGGLSAGDSEIFLSGDDGTLYAFGFPMEH